MKLDRKTVTKARGRARSSRRPHNLARPIFVAAVIEALALQMAELIGGNLVDGGSLLSRDDIADIRDEMREDPDIMSAIGKLWPELSPQQILAELWTSPARLAKAAPQLDDAQRDELLQSVGPGFSAADAPPLLDELAEILASTTPPNANAHNVNGARRSPTPGRPRHPHRVCTTGSRRRDGSRDLDGVRLDRRQPTRPTPRSGQRQTTAERAAGDRTWTYGHVIVDEAQELSEMAWRMLMRRIPNRWMTLVGDTAQTGDPAGTSSWQKILEPYVAKRWKLTELTVNYRTPSEIMDVAHRVLEEIDPEQSVPPRSVRDSGFAPWALKTTAEELESTVRRCIESESHPGITAVIAGSEVVADLAGIASDTVSVLSVKDVKGLEFDTVLIVEPADILDESPRGTNDLYVALTRATQRLGIIHVESLPSVLDGVEAAELAFDS